MTDNTLPTPDIEEVIAGIYQTVLDHDGPVDSTRSFFRIGGTSILAAKVIARISARYQIHLSLRTIFEFPAAGDLAQVVESEIRSAVSGLSDAEVVALSAREK